jgi:HSP20 family protein
MARSSAPQYALDVDRAFGDIVQRFLGSRMGPVARDDGGDETMWSPSIDVVTRGDDLVIRADLPGVDPERDLEITVQGGLLSIRGERKQERREEDDRYVRVETFYGSFYRAVPLPEGTKAEDIQARYENGVLEVVIPNGASDRRAKRVPVTATQTDGGKEIGATSTDARDRTAEGAPKRSGEGSSARSKE